MYQLMSREKALELLSSIPIRTGGAVSQHHIKIQDCDDGDCYVRAEVPVWFQNRSVVRDVLALVQKCFTHGAQVYFRDNAVILVFYQSVCDPD